MARFSAQYQISAATLQKSITSAPTSAHILDMIFNCLEDDRFALADENLGS